MDGGVCPICRLRVADLEPGHVPVHVRAWVDDVLTLRAARAAP